MTVMSPLIITCAVVGAELTRADTPYLPVTTDEICRAAVEAVKAGASIIHLHVRDEDGKSSQDVALFKTVRDGILSACDCIVQFSTGGAVGTPVNERCAPLALKPEMATLSMGTMNFGPDIYENSEGTIRAIAAQLRKHGILPEFEIFDYGMWDTVLRMREQGQLPDRFHVNFVLGVPGGMAGTVRELLLLVERLARYDRDSDPTWSVAGIGKCQLPLTMHAIAMGGHVRVGFEDNIYFRKGELATSNAQLIERVARMSALAERPVATVSQTRGLLRL